MTHLATSKAILSLARFLHTQESRVVKTSRLPVKIAAYLVSIGRLLCLAFLYRWSFTAVDLSYDCPFINIIINF